VLRWEVQVATDEANLIDAENQHELAKAALIDVMGIDQRSGIQLADLDFEPRPIRQSIEQLSTLAERHDPGLRSAEAGVESQRAGLKLAYSGFQPRINLLYNRSWEQNNTLAPDGFSTWNASVSISLPLFHSLREYASVRQARESVRSAEKMKERYRRSLSLRVKQAALNAQSAWKRLQVTQKAREEAEENLEVVNHLFEVGMAANIDVLDAQVATTMARSNAINVRYDYFSARAELERVVGVLDD
jgi:outer membrane protein TolC